MLLQQKPKIRGVCLKLGQWGTRKLISKVESHWSAWCLGKTLGKPVWTKPRSRQWACWAGNTQNRLKSKFNNVCWWLLYTFSKVLQEKHELRNKPAGVKAGLTRRRENPEISGFIGPSYWNQLLLNPNWWTWHWGECWVTEVRRKITFELSDPRLIGHSKLTPSGPSQLNKISLDKDQVKDVVLLPIFQGKAILREWHGELEIKGLWEKNFPTHD